MRCVPGGVCREGGGVATWSRTERPSSVHWLEPLRKNTGLVRHLRNSHHGPDDGQHGAAAADWLVVLPLDGAGHRTLHGAAVRVLLAGTRVLVGLRTVDGGSGYCSQSAYGAHFGLPVARSSATATYYFDVEVRPPGSEEWSVAAEGVAGGITLEWRSGR